MFTPEQAAELKSRGFRMRNAAIEEEQAYAADGDVAAARKRTEKATREFTDYIAILAKLAKYDAGVGTSK